MEQIQFINEVAGKMQKGMCDLFVGSGVSIPSGLPSWSDFLQSHLSELQIKLQEGDNLPLLAQFIVNKNSGNRNIITEAIYNTFGQDYPLNEYHNLISKFPIKTVWTTNYDGLLEAAFFDRSVRVVTSEDTLLHPHSIPDIEIVKLHGCAKTAAQGIVLTQADYDCFLYEKPKISQRLREAIINRSIFFVGYGYHDPNIHAIMTQAYHMMRETTNTHYILLCDIERKEGESIDAFEQRKFRFDYWCTELNRIGIRELVVPRSQMASILSAIDRKSHEAAVFVTGSHNIDQRAEDYAYLIGRKLAEIPRVILNNGQSAGVGSAVLSSFMKYTFDHKQDMHKRIQFFPNPYAISPDYANNPALIPNLKMARAALITNSTFVIAFPGDLGTTAEIEVARSRERLVLPVLWDKAQYNTPSIREIISDQVNMQHLKEVVPGYYGLINERKVPTEEQTVKAIQEIINGKVPVSTR